MLPERGAAVRASAHIPPGTPAIPWTPSTRQPDAIDADLRHSRRARTPSRASRRRSRAARRSRRTSTSATRRPRPNTSARPSSRPSVWRTRRRRSRRSLAKNWRRCSTRSTWPSARRRCASRREKFDPPHPPVCVKHLSWNYAQGTLAKTMDRGSGYEFQGGPGSQRRRATARSRGRSFRNDATWPTISGGTRPRGEAGHL